MKLTVDEKVTDRGILIPPLAVLLLTNAIVEVTGFRWGQAPPPVLGRWVLHVAAGSCTRSAIAGRQSRAPQPELDRSPRVSISQALRKIEAAIHGMEPDLKPEQIEARITKAVSGSTLLEPLTGED